MPYYQCLKCGTYYSDWHPNNMRKTKHKNRINNKITEHEYWTNKNNQCSCLSWSYINKYSTIIDAIKCDGLLPLYIEQEYGMKRLTRKEINQIKLLYK